MSNDDNTITGSNYKLINLAKINILLGKNGCGKSTILKDFAGLTRPLSKYISPERGGLIRYDPHAEENVHVFNLQKHHNHEPIFKEQSVARFRIFELNVLRDFEKAILNGDNVPVTFDSYFNMINDLLDEIELKRDTNTNFRINKKNSDIELSGENISSGESELISLGMECLSFVSSLAGKDGLLLLDEPDVHLHPDLQDRLIKFLLKIISNQNFNLRIIIATHSTPIVGALSKVNSTRISFVPTNSYHKTFGGKPKEIKFNEIQEQYEKIIPIFGAHPLTSVYCENPILLLEGEDDIRIWQQVFKHSDIKLKLYPIECGDIKRITKFENVANNILESIYGKTATGYSIRDGDGKIGKQLDNRGRIVRFRLGCYGPENFIISNDVLKSLGTNWMDMSAAIDEWLNLESNQNNVKVKNSYNELLAFKQNDYNRKSFKIKDSRYTLIGVITNLMNQNISWKPWEIIVGNEIAKIMLNSDECDKTENSLYDYLGEKLVNTFSKLNKKLCVIK